MTVPIAIKIKPTRRKMISICCCREFYIEDNSWRTCRTYDEKPHGRRFQEELAADCADDTDLSAQSVESAANAKFQTAFRGSSYFPNLEPTFSGSRCFLKFQNGFFRRAVVSQSFKPTFSGCRYFPNPQDDFFPGVVASLNLEKTFSGRRCSPKSRAVFFRKQRTILSCFNDS